MDNLLKHLEFEALPEAERYQKHHRCALCLGYWAIFESDRRYYLECPTCGHKASQHNSTHRANAERVTSDRGFAKGDLRPVRKISKEEADEIIRSLGF